MGMAEVIAATMLDRFGSTPVGPGAMRGIDRFAGDALTMLIFDILTIYREASGFYPDLLNPTLYSEKLNAFKLLGRIRVPESGNKLLTSSFITPQARPLIRIPDVVWRSASARLPANGTIPDGEYYLKANHGSGFCSRIRYPLSAEARAALEAMAAQWLLLDYGLGFGEWWYAAFEKEVFLECCVTTRNPSAAVLIYMFHGVPRLISVDEKLMDGSGRVRVSLLDPSFRMLPAQNVWCEPVRDLALPDDMKQNMLRAAEAVAHGFEAVRVDFIPGDDGEIYLNEITLSSNGGLPFLDRQRDYTMGGMWGRCSFLQ